MLASDGLDLTPAVSLARSWAMKGPAALRSNHFRCRGSCEVPSPHPWVCWLRGVIQETLFGWLSKN